MQNKDAMIQNIEESLCIAGQSSSAYQVMPVIR